MDDAIKARAGLTFAQAEGAEPLPSQLALKEVSAELSAVLWAIVHGSLTDCFSYDSTYGGGPYLKAPWKTILEAWWVLVLHRNVDELPEAQTFKTLVKNEITSRNYLKVFGFLQFVINRPECPHGFGRSINVVLEKNRAAYRVYDKIIAPVSSAENADAVFAALEIARAAVARGPFSHLRSASAALSAGNWTETVRQSIQSIEAAAKSIEPSASTLGPALDKLSKTNNLNPALKRAYGALYGYSSDAEGIRHSLVFTDEANVSEKEALFMFGACAAFVGYLLSMNAD